jgi:hypothetical protein
MKTYSVQAWDNLIPDDLRWRVWDHVQNQTYHATRKDVQYPEPGSIIYYKPVDGKKEYLDESVPSVNNQYMHRCVFGMNDIDVRANHPVIGELWETINGFLGNRFVIDGDAEGMADPQLERQYSLCYVNAQPSETIKRSHGIHRDTIDLDNSKHFTLLYIANLTWYPTWMAENVFYADDESTGDLQQFQKGYGQSRGFPVGEPYAIVAPAAGRVIMYDGRALHTTKPTAPWADHMRYAVVFRIREK